MDLSQYAYALDDEFWDEIGRLIESGNQRARELEHVEQMRTLLNGYGNGSQGGQEDE